MEFDLGYIDCYTDVLTLLDRRCSGRRSCEVRIPDAEFEATGPCLKELKTYLEVGYHCVRGTRYCYTFVVIIDDNHYKRIAVSRSLMFTGATYASVVDLCVVSPYLFSVCPSQVELN